MVVVTVVVMVIIMEIQVLSVLEHLGLLQRLSEVALGKRGRYALGRRHAYRQSISWPFWKQFPDSATGFPLRRRTRCGGGCVPRNRQHPLRLPLREALQRSTLCG